MTVIHGRVLISPKFHAKYKLVTGDVGATWTDPYTTFLTFTESTYEKISWT